MVTYRIRPLACWWRGHAWSGWGDNGCYLIHTGEVLQPPQFHEHWFTSFCSRCGSMQGRWVRTRVGEPTKRPA